MSILIIRNNPYNDKDAIKNVPEYIVSYSKTFGVVGGNGILPDCVADTMSLINNVYGIHNGKQILHFIVSFSKCENVSVDNAKEIAEKICCIFMNYCIVYGVHQDTDELHIHFGVNPINRYNLRKLKFTRSDKYNLKRMINNILMDYGILCEHMIDKYEP